MQMLETILHARTGHPAFDICTALVRLEQFVPNKSLDDLDETSGSMDEVDIV